MILAACIFFLSKIFYENSSKIQHSEFLSKYKIWVFFFWFLFFFFFVGKFKIWAETLKMGHVGGHGPIRARRPKIRADFKNAWASISQLKTTSFGWINKSSTKWFIQNYFFYFFLWNWKLLKKRKVEELFFYLHFILFFLLFFECNIFVENKAKISRKSPILFFTNLVREKKWSMNLKIII